jgi:two-component system, NtrC family, sensor histidine kinase HydH
MFRVDSEVAVRGHRLAIAGLLALSLAAFCVTVWVMIDFLHEQEIVHALIGQLPPEAALAAQDLEGELRWQFRLSILVVLNLVVTALAVALLWRAYGTSQASLRDIKAKAADVLSSMDLAVITTDLTGIVTFINQRGIELLALNDDYVGRPVAEITHQIPLEAIRQKARAVSYDDPPEDYHHSAQAASRILRVFWQPLRSHEQDVIGSIIQLRDVTERVHMDDRMRRMERYMGLGSLLAGLHHEIRNPLAALSLHVQLLVEAVGETPTTDDVLQMLSVIKTEMTRVGGVLENFRDFASVARLNTAPVNVAVLIDRQVRLITPQADRQKVAIHIDCEDALPSIDADCVRLEQVLLNLFINGMEAMPTGGTLTVRSFRNHTSDESECVTIQVIDTGPGIPDNIRDRIFDPYFTTRSEGTGMGLALCDKILRQHNGSLEFHRSVSGTVFEMSLPID